MKKLLLTLGSVAAVAAPVAAVVACGNENKAPNDSKAPHNGKDASGKEVKANTYGIKLSKATTDGFMISIPNIVGTPDGKTVALENGNYFVPSKTKGTKIKVISVDGGFPTWITLTLNETIDINTGSTAAFKVEGQKALIGSATAKTAGKIVVTATTGDEFVITYKDAPMIRSIDEIAGLVAEMVSSNVQDSLKSLAEYTIVPQGVTDSINAILEGIDYETKAAIVRTETDHDGAKSKVLYFNAHPKYVAKKEGEVNTYGIKLSKATTDGFKISIPEIKGVINESIPLAKGDYFVPSKTKGTKIKVISVDGEVPVLVTLTLRETININNTGSTAKFWIQGGRIGRNINISISPTPNAGKIVATATTGDEFVATNEGVPVIESINKIRETVAKVVSSNVQESLKSLAENATAPQGVIDSINAILAGIDYETKTARIRNTMDRHLKKLKYLLFYVKHKDASGKI